MKPDQIEQAAADLQCRINQAIADRCDHYPAIGWPSLAEQVVEELLDGEKWEFARMNAIGRPPQIAITRYNLTRARS